VCIVSIPYAGVGRHTLAVVIEDVHKVKALGIDSLLVAPILYTLAIFLSKSAILNLFLHIFTMGVARKLTYAVYLTVILQTIAFIFAAIFQCSPISLLWTTTTRGNCINTQALFMYSSIPNIITDLVMLVLPLPTIWNLKAATHVKVGVTLTLLTASVCVPTLSFLPLSSFENRNFNIQDSGMITSILRTTAFIRTDIFSDPAWYACDLFAYAIAEPGTYFMAACFPTYRPLGAYLKRKGFFSMSSSRYYFSSRRRLGSSAGEQDVGTAKSETPSAEIKKGKTPRGFDSIALSAIERDEEDDRIGRV